MSRRRERWVFVLTVTLSLGGLGLLVGCPPFQAKAKEIVYQEVGLIQLEDRFVPSEIVLVAGRPARIHVTNGVKEDGQAVEIPSLAVTVPLKNAEVSTISLSQEQLKDLDGKTFRCPQTKHGGAFRVVQEGEPIQSKKVDGAVEVAVVMTADLAAPHNVFLRRDVPVRLYVAKTRGGEEDDTLYIENITKKDETLKTDISNGEISTQDFSPAVVGTFQFYAVTTPKSGGIFHVVE